MSGWINYKGIEVPYADPAESNGEKLKQDLMFLADHVPTYSTTSPTTSDDVSKGYFVGAHWFNTSTQIMWICISASVGAAVWRGLYKRLTGAIVLCAGGSSGTLGVQMDTGGNARGTDAIDFQSSRASSNQVASGTRSFVAGGQNNRASGSFAHAEGSATVASNSGCHAEGSGTTASADWAHAEGSSTSAIGFYSHAEGISSVASGNIAHAEGQSTTASGSASHSEGQSTTASGTNAHAEGQGTSASSSQAHAEGLGTTASGGQSHAEGSSTVASGSGSHAGGTLSKAHLRSQWARAAGGHSDQRGTAQTTNTVLMRRTTDATATELTLNGDTPGASSRFAVLDGQTLGCFINIVGRKENGGANDHAMFLRQVLIRREGTTTQLVGAVQTVGTDINPATWGGVTITADDTNESLKIDVTGIASTNIRWTATVMASEAADAAI